MKVAKWQAKQDRIKKREERLKNKMNQKTQKEQLGYKFKQCMKCQMFKSKTVNEKQI